MVVRKDRQTETEREKRVNFNKKTGDKNVNYWYNALQFNSKFVYLPYVSQQSCQAFLLFVCILREVCKKKKYIESY